MTRLRLRRGSILSDISQMRTAPLAPIPPVQPFGGGGSGGPGVGPLPTSGINGGNYAETRNVIELTFDDSLDSSFPLECFFQMPVGTLQIYSANAFVQQKPFRMYSSAASSSSTSSSQSGAHNHVNSSSTAATSADGTGATTTESGHTHLDGDGITTTGSGTGHWHNGPSHTHTESTWPLAQTENAGLGHTHTISTSTTTTLTPGIFESGPTGTFSIFIADNGSSYGSAIVTGLTSTPAGGQDLSGQLTKVSGDKRMKITATGLQRVQILIVLDLLIKVTLT